MGQILCSKESFEEAADYFERAISKACIFFTENKETWGFSLLI